MFDGARAFESVITLRQAAASIQNTEFEARLRSPLRCLAPMYGRLPKSARPILRKIYLQYGRRRSRIL
jgi:hypothetical protein